jgi:cobalt/nickel transport system permease protein
MGGVAMRNVLVGLGLAAVVAGAVLAWFASANPDGLEWSIAGVTGSTEVESTSSAHEAASALQDRTALLPDYAFKSPEAAEGDADSAVAAGTSASGLVGAGLTLLAAAGVGFALRRRSNARLPHGP